MIETSVDLEYLVSEILSQTLRGQGKIDTDDAAAGAAAASAAASAAGI